MPVGRSDMMSVAGVFVDPLTTETQGACVILALRLASWISWVGSELPPVCCKAWLCVQVRTFSSSKTFELLFSIEWLSSRRGGGRRKPFKTFV